MKKSCLITVIATLAAVAGALAAVGRSWTSTSVCCLARIRLRPLSLPQSSPQKTLLPRMPQNKPNTEKRTRLVPASCGALFYTPH
mgnify:CR=1 FL=1